MSVIEYRPRMSRNEVSASELADGSKGGSGVVVPFVARRTAPEPTRNPLRTAPRRVMSDEILRMCAARRLP